MYKNLMISMTCALFAIGLISGLILFDRYKSTEKYRTYITLLQNEQKKIEAEYERKLSEVKYEKEMIYNELVLKIDKLTENNNELSKEVSNLNLQLDNIHVVDKPVIYNVSASHYTASADETDSTPHITATGSKPTVGRTIAVSPDLFHRLRGSKVYLPDRGVFTVEDRMNDRYTMKVDILVDSKKEAFEKGVERDLQMVVLPKL